MSIGMQNAENASPCRVVIDHRSDRTDTVTGLALLRRFLRRTIWAGLIPAVVVMTIFAVNNPTRRLALLLIGVPAGFFALWFGATVFHAAALLSDYQEKRKLADKYGISVRFGLDTLQRRSVRVFPPPPDLEARIAEALGRLARDIRIEKKEGRRIEAFLPRKGNQLRCRMVVEMSGNSNGSATVEVESKLTEPLGFTDLGRNIVNVEEFQLELRRLLEGESSSEREKRSPPG
jgi:hypothetical protein